MIFEFNQIQINNLMNLMSDMMSIKIKKIIDYQNNQFQMILNRLDDQIEQMHSKMYEFAFSTSFQRFISSFILFSQRVTRETKQSTFDFFELFLFFSNTYSKDFLSKLKIEKMNFFDFEQQKKNKSFTIIVHSNKHVFYKNVYVFVERLQNMIKQHDEKTIENLVIACLRDEILK